MFSLRNSTLLVFLSFSSQTNASVIDDLGPWSLTATDVDNDNLTVTRDLIFDEKHVVQVLLVFDPVAQQLDFVTVSTCLVRM